MAFYAPQGFLHHGILGTSIYACIGGTSVSEEIRKLEVGVQVITSTPGHIYEIILPRTLRTRNIKMLVLNEANELLNMGFKDQIYDVYRYLPPGVQAVLLSTTLPNNVIEWQTTLWQTPFVFLSSVMNWPWKASSNSL